jgi:uncharacterized protein YjbJ (UPF0337 family)
MVIGWVVGYCPLGFKQNMSTSSSMPKVTGPTKEAAGYAKEELGEKLGNVKMAEEGRDLRNRGRMEQGKDILVGQPGTGTTHEASDLKTKLEGMGAAKTGPVPSPPLLHDIQVYDKSHLLHVETIDKTHPPLTGGLKKTVAGDKSGICHGCEGRAASHTSVNTETKEFHQMKAAEEMSMAKDSHLPFTERVGHAMTGIAEKTKAVFSSSEADKNKTSTK